MLRQVFVSRGSLIALQQISRWSSCLESNSLANFANEHRQSTVLVFGSKIHTTARLDKEKDRREMISSAPPKDQGVEGERSFDVDFNNATRFPTFPDAKTPDLVFDGVRFAELPVCHVKSSKNNTIISLADFRGKILWRRSCGLEGFKNSKKGTNIAAQTTGLNVGKKGLEKGVINVRIKIQGLGPGRMASVRGLQMSGLNIVSITDDTPIPTGPRYARPRKQRKI